MVYSRLQDVSLRGLWYPHHRGANARQKRGLTYLAPLPSTGGFSGRYQVVPGILVVLTQTTRQNMTGRHPLQQLGTLSTTFECWLPRKRPFGLCLVASLCGLQRQWDCTSIGLPLCLSGRCSGLRGCPKRPLPCPLMGPPWASACTHHLVFWAGCFGWDTRSGGHFARVA